MEVKTSPTVEYGVDAWGYKDSPLYCILSGVNTITTTTNARVYLTSKVKKRDHLINKVHRGLLVLSNEWG